MIDVTATARRRLSRSRMSQGGGARRPPLWLTVAAAVAASAAAIPLVYLVVRAGEAGWSAASNTLLRDRVLQLTVNTVLLTAAVTVTCLVLDVLVGALLARFRFPGGPVWLLLAALPLAVPSYLAAYGWIVLFPGTQGFFPSWLVMSAVCLPYVSLPVAAVLRGSSVELESVARTLGCRPLTAFRIATWPRIRVAAMAGALLAALYSLADFGAVAMLRFQTLTWGIKSAYSSSFDRNQAAVLATVLVVLALIVVLGERKLRRPIAVDTGRRHTPTRLDALRSAIALGIVSLGPALGVGVPLAGLVIQLLRAETLRAVDVPRLLETLGFTLFLAVAGSVAAVILALPIAMLAARYRGRIVSIIESVGYLGHALPGIVVGLSLVFFSLSAVPFLYQSVVLLVFAYAVLFMSKSIGSTRAGLVAVPQSLTDLARTQGLSASQTWWRVSFRLAAPSIGVGALLVAVAILKELPATLLLRPTGVSTLAVELWNRTSVLEYGAAAPYAALLVVVAAIPAFLLSGVRSAAKGVS